VRCVLRAGACVHSVLARLLLCVGAGFVVHRACRTACEAGSKMLTAHPASHWLAACACVHTLVCIDGVIQAGRSVQAEGLMFR
jgi:hypothetical protein